MMRTRIGAIVIALGMSSAFAMATEFCQDKWPGDFSMQNWCMKQQNAALDEIREFRQKYKITRDYDAAQIHKKAAIGDVGAQILVHCIKQWNPDYSMINWCLKQQEKAAQEMGVTE